MTRAPVRCHRRKKRAPEGALAVTESRLLSAVYGLAVEVDVEAFDFDVALHAQPDHDVDKLQNDVGHDGAIDEGAEHALKLGEDLAEIAIIDPAFPQRVDGIAGEDAGKDRAQRPTDTMNAPRIERVVIAERPLHRD